MDMEKNLKKLRGSKNRTQQNVADYVEGGRKTYINWETGILAVNFVSLHLMHLNTFFY